MSRVFALLVAAIFALGLVPTGAWGETGSSYTTPADKGSITLTNAEDGENYKVYRIFDLLSFSDDTPANAMTANHGDDRYSYGLLSTSNWANFFDANSKPATSADVIWGSDYFTIDQNHPITIGTDANAKTYYPVSIKDGGPFDAENPDVVGSVGSVADENTRELALASAAVVQPFARAALDYALDAANNVSADRSQDDVTATTEGAATDKVKIEFPNLPLGYYLVSSSLGSVVSLDTTNKNVTVADKNVVPSIEKEVKLRASENTNRETGTGQYAEPDAVWGDNTDYEIGDAVTFKTTVTVPKGAHNLKVHDVMEKVLALISTAGNGDDDFKVYARTDNATTTKLVQQTYGTASAYTINASPTDGCDFEITFDDAWLANLNYDSATNETTVEVEYKAKLTKDAVVMGDDESVAANFPQGESTAIATPDEGNADPQVSQKTHDYDVVETTIGSTTTRTADNKNTNNTLLTFGERSSTEWDSATVECFDFDLVKTGDKANAGAHDFSLLDGATFSLHPDNGNDAAGAAPITMIRTTSTETPAVTGVTDAIIYAKPDATQTTDGVTTFATSKTQKITFRGLEAGTYWLREIEAPLGCNKLSGDIKVVVGTGGNITYKMSGAGEQDHAVAANGTIAYAATQSTYTDTSNGGVHVINRTGPELPSTGGIGTTIFYVVGGILVAGSAVLLITKKRMSTED